MTKESNPLIWFLLALLLLPSQACTRFWSSRIEQPYGVAWDKDDRTPKTAVILPFTNETIEPDLDRLVRKSFYGHFCLKNYHDFELGEVDHVLEILDKKSGRSWRDLSPAELGEIFHADFLIYGKVREFEKTFLGIYSQIDLRVDVRMVSCRDGKVVFRQEMDKKSHDGGVPFSLLGLVPATVRSGFHMKRERTLDLIDRLCRELAGRIPDPPLPLASPAYVEVQVASFTEKSRALKTLTLFEEKGFTARIETVSLGGHLWHRLLLGPYFSLSRAEKARAEIAGDSTFEPILVRRYPPEEGRRSNGARQ